MALVSVIIPAFNHAAFLPQRMDSVLNQTFQDFEIIILDDASSDNSRSVINTYNQHPKISHVVFNAVNSGSTFKQWSKGLALAKGKYIWIAESDDYCDLTLLQKLVDTHSSVANIGLTYCRSLPVNDQNEFYDNSNWWIKRVDAKRWDSNYTNDGRNEVSNYLAVQCTIPNASAVLFTAECFNKINWESINYTICGDWYVYATILQQYNIAYIAEPLNYHRNHGTNARSIYAKNNFLEQYRVLRYINKTFNVNRSAKYYKALDERMGGFIVLIKNKTISIKGAIKVLWQMRTIDGYFIIRFFKIIFFKLLKVDFSFK